MCGPWSRALPGPGAHSEVQTVGEGRRAAPAQHTPVWHSPREAASLSFQSPSLRLWLPGASLTLDHVSGLWPHRRSRATQSPVRITGYSSPVFSLEPLPSVDLWSALRRRRRGGGQRRSASFSFAPTPQPECGPSRVGLRGEGTRRRYSLSSLVVL